jgi:hypothetical protein
MSNTSRAPATRRRAFTPETLPGSVRLQADLFSCSTGLQACLPDSRRGCAARWPHRCSPESCAPLAIVPAPRRLIAGSVGIQTWQAPTLLVRSVRITLKRSRRGRLAARTFRGITASARAEASCDRHSRGATEGVSPSVVSALRRTTHSDYRREAGPKRRIV